LPVSCDGLVDGTPCFDGKTCTVDDQCVLGACTGDPVPGCVTIEIEPNGGSYLIPAAPGFGEGLGVEVPPGAVDIPIEIGLMPPSTSAAPSALNGAELATLQLEPSGLELGAPITFVIPFDVQDHPGLVPDTALAMIRDDGDPEWHALPGAAYVDVASHTLTVSVPHFSFCLVNGISMSGPVGDGCADPTFPTVLLIHGIDGKSSSFGAMDPNASTALNPLLGSSVPVDWKESVPPQWPSLCVASVDYDSNLDIDLNGRRMTKAIEWLRAARDRPVLIVAHSMGGLVARAMLRANDADWAQANIHGLVTVATPHRV